MKSYSIIIIFFIAATVHSLAQAPLVKMWDKRFGGEEGDTPTSFQQTSDKGYIIGGYSFSGANGDKTQPSQGQEDYWIIKIDSFGNKQWDKRFGGSSHDGLYSLQQTKDGGYILGGTSRSGISGDKTQPSWGGGSDDDYWIVKIDSLGNKQWDKRFGGIYYDALRAVQQTEDGGYILGGRSVSNISGDKSQDSWGHLEDYWIVKIDSIGNKQWDKRFGGTGTEQLTSLQQTKDKGYILGGYSKSRISGDKTQDNWDTSGYTYDYWIVKIDSLGNKKWDKRFGNTDRDYLESVIQTIDGGYILGGISDSVINGDKSQPSKGSLDYWIVKTDSLGNKQWDKSFGGIREEDALGNITQTSDTGYLIAGTSYSPASGDKSENNLGEEQPWIIKIDSVGNKQWDKTIITSLHEEMGNAIETRDTCYVIVHYSFIPIGSNIPLDYLSIKYCQCKLIVTTASYTAHVSHYGASDGAAKVIATGGLPPYNFLWSDGQTSSVPVGLSAGKYFVTVTDFYGCTATTSITIEEGPIGIRNVQMNNISLYPNPTDGSVTLQMPPRVLGMASLELKLYNALGRQLLEQNVEGARIQQGITLDLKPLMGNIFFLNITTETGMSRMLKVVKY